MSAPEAENRQPSTLNPEPTMSDDSKSPQDEKLAFLRAQSVVSNETRTVTISGLPTKWVRELDAVLDAARDKSAPVDIEPIRRCLIRTATKMLNLAEQLELRSKQ